MISNECSESCTSSSSSENESDNNEDEEINENDNNTGTADDSQSSEKWNREKSRNIITTLITGIPEENVKTMKSRAKLIEYASTDTQLIDALQPNNPDSYTWYMQVTSKRLIYGGNPVEVNRKRCDESIKASYEPIRMRLNAMNPIELPASVPSGDNEKMVELKTSNGEHYYVRESDFKSFVYACEAKLGHQYRIKNDTVKFFSKIVKLSPIEEALLNAYYPYIYDGHYRMGDYNMALFVQNHEFNKTADHQVGKIDCMERKCGAYIQATVFNGEVRLHREIQHNHAPELEPIIDKPVVKLYGELKKTVPIQKVQNAPSRSSRSDFPFKAQFRKGKGTANDVLYDESGFSYSVNIKYKGTKVTQLICCKRRRGNCGRRAYVKEIRGEKWVRFEGEHNHH